MKFTNHKNKLERPYIVYADIESLNVPRHDISADEKEEILRKKVEYGEIQRFKAPGRRITKHRAIATCFIYRLHI